MASKIFDSEKSIFREFYSDNFSLLDGANKSFCALINALLTHSANISVSKIEGRVKDKEECIRKFNLKYRKGLEAEDKSYSIKDHISDLIGLRIVCLYEDDIEKVKDTLSEHFEVMDITDKISEVESTEGSFGYKGLHLDLKLGEKRREMPEYKAFVDFNFEIQIRTIIQDSWSVLDHKIKYKKSIPNRLKRRINTLAALFELADREFREIRSATDEEIRKAAEDDSENIRPEVEVGPPRKIVRVNGKLTAFNFLKIANHFFNDYEFEPLKVDGFTEEIVNIEPTIRKSDFNKYLRETIAKVKSYKESFEEQNQFKETLNPYTVIRHCLYLSNKDLYASILTNISKDNFEKWLSENDN